MGCTFLPSCTVWEMVDFSRVPPQINVIANQCAHWCDNLHPLLTKLRLVWGMVDSCWLFTTIPHSCQALLDVGDGGFDLHFLFPQREEKIFVLLPSSRQQATLHRSVAFRWVRIHIPGKKKKHTKRCAFLFGGGWWIRTTEGIASRFTVCPLWPLGKSPIFIFRSLEPVDGLEPPTY